MVIKLESSLHLQCLINMQSRQSYRLLNVARCKVQDHMAFKIPNHSLYEQTELPWHLNQVKSQMPDWVIIVQLTYVT